ncbi:MAG TPA: PD-(D/E)XK nuclease family protein [Candidatus Brocadiales bacterium]|nr:PD-(D/E)XK nuclease family protein [Candidatus Brocadiales bacterium]
MSEKSLIIGRAGCGRTTLLLETFCSSIKTRPPDGVLFLLPTHSQVEHVKDVIIRKGFASGFIEEGICTFSQLARDTLGYNGPKGPITELEKGVILREALRGATLKYFKGEEGFQGLHMALLRFVKELKEDGQYPAQFHRAVNEFLKGQRTALPEKYPALSEVYSLFQAVLEKRGLLDEDDLLNQLLRSLEADETLLSPKKLLLVDGFHDFTPVEFRILRMLIKRIPRVFVSLVLDAETKDSPLHVGARCNAPLHCQAVYKELKSLGLKPQPLQGFQRSTSPTLRQVEKGLFNPATEPIEAEAALEIVEAADLRDEVEQIARRIYKMVSGGEAEYHDVAIVFREIALYRDVIEAVFHEYNIPVRVHTRRPLIENPLVKGILSLLKVFGSAWKDEEVLHALKSPYTMLPHSEVDSLEYGVLETGRLDSREAWLALMENRLGPPLPRQALTCLPKTKEFIKDLAKTEKELDGPHPVSFFRSWLLRLINRFLSLSTVGAQNFEPLLKEESQGLRAFLELLDRQCKIITVPVTFAEFFDDLKTNLSSCFYTPKDKRHEVVNVIDALEARQWEKPVVFVGGLLEKQFPRQGREDIFLKDRERRAFKRLTGVDLQEVLRRTHEEERFLFYVALTRAQKRLILSYPATDGQGRPTLPSFYLEEVKRLFTHESYKKVFHKRSPGDFVPGPREILTQKDLRDFVFYNLTAPHPPQVDIVRGVYNRELCERTPWLEGLSIALERPGERELGAADCLKEIISSFSATQLGDYAQCPFLHFCRWVLRLRPLPNRAEEGLSPTLQGGIVHETLQRYYSELAVNKSAPPITSLEAHFQESFASKTRGIPLGFKEEKLKREMLHALKAFAEQDREYITRFAFRPRYAEVGFGKETAGRSLAIHGDVTTPTSLPPLELRDKKGNRVRLTGRIDRIDVAEMDGETLGLVIDYKYSKEAANGSKLIKDLKEGNDLQLPIYVMVARDLLGLRPVGAQFYSLRPPGRSGIIALPLPNKGEHMSQEDMEALLESCKEHLFRQVEGILAGDKRVSPRDVQYCHNWCEYRDVCRFERGHHKRHEG